MSQLKYYDSGLGAWVTAVVGAEGAQGIQGTIGIQGITGLQGTTGDTGVQGIEGTQGIQGTIGIQGHEGFQGTTGAQGITGDTGIQGATGIQGDTGIQGIQGVIGASTGMPYIFNSSTTAGDTGSGQITYDNASVASVTQLRISETNNLSDNVSSWLSTFDVSTAQYRALITISNASGTVVHGFAVSSQDTDAGTYRYWTVLPYAVVGTFSNNEPVYISASLTGLQGSLGIQGTNGLQGIQGFQGTTGIQGNTGGGGDPTLVVNPAKTTHYTVTTGDEGDLLPVNSASNVFISIPTHATTSFLQGTQINILRQGAGTVYIQAVTPATTQVQGTPGLQLRSQYSAATIVKLGDNHWVVVGDVSA